MIVKAMDFVSLGSNMTANEPSWDLVEKALRALNGETADGVVLQMAEQCYMGISGGRNNRYLVAGYLKGFGGFVCASGEKGGTPIDVVVVGDLNTVESKNVVGIEAAVLAAKAFFFHGELAKEMKWEHDQC